MSRLRRWLILAAEKIERIADPDREKRVEAFARAVEETMVRQRGAFDLEQTLNALEVPAGDDPLIAARVYEFAARRAWADSRITSKERKVLEWIRSVLKLDARSTREIEGDIARTAFYRYFQTAIADGVLDVQEVRILNHVAHQLDTTLRTLVLQDFRQEVAAFLGEQLTMVIHRGTPSKEAWQQLLSNAEALDLSDDDMLTLLQPRAERLSASS